MKQHFTTLTSEQQAALVAAEPVRVSRFRVMVRDAEGDQHLLNLIDFDRLREAAGLPAMFEKQRAHFCR